jgi:7-cyano-7-deazaguanine reductase
MIKNNNKIFHSKLGKKTTYSFDNPDISTLEKINNQHPDVDYSVRFSCPEFTSLCPITSQPDFAHIIIDYIPNKFILESKSLKLYLFSYRNFGGFHEDCTIKIAKDIISVIKPKWFRIGGYWYPRGGIPIDIFFQTSSQPKNVWIKDQEIPEYKSR